MRISVGADSYIVSGRHNPCMPPSFWFKFNASGIYHYYVNGKHITRRVAAILMAEGIAVEKRMWRGERCLPAHNSGRA